MFRLACAAPPVEIAGEALVTPIFPGVVILVETIDLFGTPLLVIGVKSVARFPRGHGRLRTGAFTATIRITGGIDMFVLRRTAVPRVVAHALTCQSPVAAATADLLRSDIFLGSAVRTITFLIATRIGYRVGALAAAVGHAARLST